MPMAASWHPGWQADHNLPLRARRLLMQHQALAREYRRREPFGSLALWLISCRSHDVSGGCCLLARMLRGSILRGQAGLKHDATQCQQALRLKAGLD